jgi:hypothetical protein
MAQSQYLIVATKRCRTHREGTLLLFTGPRQSVAKGWRVIARADRPLTDGGAGLSY